MRCPLCKAGSLSLTPGDLVYEERVLATSVYLCSSCREMLLDGAQLDELRAAIRREGLAGTEEEVARIVERAIIRTASSPPRGAG